MVGNSLAGHLRSIHLGVPELAAATDFYTRVWGLEHIGTVDDRVLLRGQGREHHILTLGQSACERAVLEGIEFAAESVQALEAIAARAPSFGIGLLRGVHSRRATLGGGSAIELQAPGDVVVSLSADVLVHEPLDDRTKPEKVTHVVINSVSFDRHERLFTGLLGLRLSDRTRHMDFLRSASDHHSVALAHGDNDRLNHIAFEMRDLDGQMYGAGRVIEAGRTLEWGPGRHGPGNNVFCYFIDPDGLAIEYTSEVEQITSDDHVAGTAEQWDSFPRRPCRWGIARTPSERLKAAFASRLAPDRSQLMPTDCSQ